MTDWSSTRCWRDWRICCRSRWLPREPRCLGRNVHRHGAARNAIPGAAWPRRAGQRARLRRSARATARSIPIVDRSIVVRITAEDGTIGWGETYGICAPRATCEIINDLLAPVTIGADPADVERIWDELYGLMRVRGCSGGFHVDAIAAIDIALWDLHGKQRGVPIRDLLGTDGQCHRARLSVGPARRDAGQSGSRSPLKNTSRASRVQIRRRGEPRRHRRGDGGAAPSLGPDAQIMVDLHWKFTAAEALELIAALAPYRPLLRRGAGQARGPCGAGARRARKSGADRRGRGMVHGVRGAQSSRRGADRHPAARDGPHRHHAVPPHRRAGSGAWGRDRSSCDDRHRTIPCGQPAGLGNIAAPVEA